MKNKYKYKLYGAILGDLAGQPYEFPIMKGPYTDVNIHNPNSHFTDDTLMTLASASFLLGRFNTIEEAYKDMGKRYPGNYYGNNFKEWLSSPIGTIGTSYGNGCLMRISPYMYVENSLPQIIDSVRCSHHNTISYESVMKLYKFYAKDKYPDGDDLNNIKPFTKFQVKADKTINFCLQVFVLGFMSTHKKIILAIEQGGDTDTNASIIAEMTNFHYQDITDKDVKYIENKLDNYLLEILREFNEKY